MSHEPGHPHPTEQETHVVALTEVQLAVLRVGVDYYGDWLEPTGGTDDDYWDAQAALLEVAERKIVGGGGTAELSADELGALADAAIRVQADFGTDDDERAEWAAEIGLTLEVFDAAAAEVHHHLNRTVER